MNELQIKSLQLAKEFDHLCREIGVEYYLTAGSLIGALRHKGFIPWDDDVDVIMTRDNWEKFYSKTKDSLPEGIVINSQYDNEYLAMTANHFVDMRTTAIYRYDVTNPESNGVMLDVIIMDPVPENEEDCQEYVDALTAYTEQTVLPYQYSLRNGKTTHFARYWNLRSVIGLRKTLNLISKDAFHHSDKSSRFYVQRFAGSPHFWPKEYYGSPRYVPFEDTMLPVPEHAEDCLCIGYDDDWMYIPTGGVLRSTHEYCVRNMNLPGELIAENFENHIDRDVLMKKYVKRKKLMVSQTNRKFKAAMDADVFASEYVRLIYNEKCVGIDFDEIIAAKNYEFLETFFDEYIKIQCTSHYLGSSSLEGWLNWYRKCHPWLIDIGDDALYAVLFLLMHKKKLAWIGKLLKARKALDRPLTENLQNMNDLYLAIKTATSAYECGEDETCRETIERFLPVYPENIFLLALDLKQRRREGLSGQQLLDALAKAQEHHPEDPELLCLQADACFDLCQRDQALNLFGELIGTTNHGLVLLHIREKLEELIAADSGDKLAYNLWLAVRRRCGEEDVPETREEEVPAETAQENTEEAVSPTDEGQKTEQDLEAESTGDIANIAETQEAVIPDMDESIEEHVLTDVQKRRLLLLTELDEICRTNKIKYYLFGKTLLQAARNGKYIDEYGDISVAMTPANCRKFTEAVKAMGQNNRYIDSMEENSHFHRFCVRYCDTESLDFEVSRSGCADQFGMFVTIEILRYPSKNKWVNSADQMLEAGWECIHSFKWTSLKRVISWFVVSVMCLILGRKNTGKLLYRRFMKGPKKKSTAKYYLKPFWGKRTYYPSYIFKYTSNIKLENVKFSTMKLFNVYLKEVYGTKWKTKKFTKSKENPYTRILDANLPSKVYLDYLGEQRIDRHAIWKHRVTTDRKYAKVNTLGTETGKYWDIMCQCGERFRLWEKYMPMKPYLIELYKANRIKKLRYELKDYYDTAVAFSKKGLGICFDKKIFELLEYTLFEEGKVAIARKLRRLIPKQDWKPIKPWKTIGETGMRQAKQSDISAILLYLKRYVSDCLYMYVDIAKYGLDNPHMQVWFDADNEGISLVVMKYHTSISVFTNRAEWDSSAVAALILKEAVGSVTGKKEIIEQIVQHCEDSYEVSYGAVYRLAKHHDFDFDGIIENATAEDAMEIAELIVQDDGIGSYYEVKDLADQLAERMESNMGRSYVIRQDGRIVAHIASYAEFDGLATTGGLIVDPSIRGGAVYGSVLESYLVKKLNEEGFRTYTFVTARMRKKLLNALGNECVGEYGKMTRINGKE